MTIKFIAPAAALALMACTGAPEALADDAAAPRTITVNGTGEAFAAPDMAIVSIGVTSEAPTAGEALAKNNADMAATVAKLKELGVADRDLQTSGLSLNPQYDYENNRRSPRVIGFAASNTLTVRLRDLSKAGAVIDEAVRAGANALGGVSFGFDDPAPLKADARKNAVRDARATAELLAKESGVTLGRILTINDGYVAAPSPRPAMMRMEAAQASAVPMEAGESGVNASVTMVFEIK